MTSAPTSNDPLSRIEEELWFALESHAGLAALVQVGNRPKLTGPQDQPFKDSLTNSDVPELSMLPAGGEADTVGQGVSSSSVGVILRWSIGIVTDEIRTNRLNSVHPVLWACLQALWRVKYGANNPLDYVNLIRATAFFDQVTDPVKDRGAQGWKGVLQVEVRAVFPREEVLA